MILITIYWGGANEKAGTGQKRNRSIFRFSTLAFAIHAVSMGGLVVLPMQQAYAETAGVKSYNIPAGRLANVLNQFAEQSGTSIAMDAQQLQGLHSLGLKGNFAVEQGFEQLLKATEFNAVKVGQGYTLTKNLCRESLPLRSRPLVCRQVVL